MSPLLTLWPVSEKLFEKLTQIRKDAEKRVVFGRFYYPLRSLRLCVR